MTGELMVESDVNGLNLIRRRGPDGSLGQFIGMSWAEAFKLMGLLARECGQHLESTETELKRWMETG